MSDVGDIPMPVIGEHIRRLRNDVLMTQDDLAAAAGVSTDLSRKVTIDIDAEAVLQR